MENLRYEAPLAVADAVQLLAASEVGAARVLAGGTDLLVQMRAGFADPALIVDIKGIPETRRVAVEGDALVVGAALSGAELRDDGQLARLFPGVAEAAELIGSDQIQGRASIGGNLCNASPAADTVPALVTGGAECVIAGPSGTRTLQVAEFVTAPGRNQLERGEFLVSLRLPTPPARTSDAYLRFTPRTEMDIAVVGAAVRITLGSDGTCTDAHVALGAVAATVISVPAAATELIGSSLDDASLARAAQAASEACRPIDDKRGTVAFRRQVAGVLTKRAAAIAGERAGSR